MRCPPSLVFDDLYQRCEWPGAGVQTPNYRLGSLRNNKEQLTNRKYQTPLMSTIQQQNSTESSLVKVLVP